MYHFLIFIQIKSTTLPQHEAVTYHISWSFVLISYQFCWSGKSGTHWTIYWNIKRSGNKTRYLFIANFLIINSQWNKQFSMPDSLFSVVILIFRILERPQYIFTRQMLWNSSSRWNSTKWLTRGIIAIISLHRHYDNSTILVILLSYDFNSRKRVTFLGNWTHFGCSNMSKILQWIVHRNMSMVYVW